MECLFNDLFKKKEFEKQIKPIVEAAFKGISIQFEFFKSTGNKWNWTSLMGCDKKKMLEKFPITQFISGTRGQKIEQLWLDAENWVRTFCCPSEGYINSSENFGLYRKADVIPYMHVFAKHIPLFMQQLKTKNLSLQFFSTSSIEKKITIR
ncbi:hypothetical protein C2G38_1546213 [Gigaspora rosea]|uniref:Uncharacterized protein n=1 Tax=Gigaspora rosea TaxID=44941 RepID=A0A397V222_9GLOM|nr:hypothetical protein C2G38_1546213 [Gigaspora rosea]